jgi:hypothetical protein
MTSLIQPMDQNVISNFKFYYLQRTFKELVEETDGKDKQSISDWWKSFDIMKGIRNIVAAWEEVTINHMNSSWKKLWPEVCHNFRGFEENEAVVVNDIVEFANQLGMDEVDINNVWELLQSQLTSLTNKELVDLNSNILLRMMTALHMMMYPLETSPQEF